MKLWKKSLSLLLVLCMLLSVLPMGVFATETEEEEEEEVVLLTGTASEEALSGEPVLLDDGEGTTYVTKDGFYSILHLDAGRKYFSPTVIKSFIDDMASQGFNQLELYLSDSQGFRFLLDDSKVTTDYGTYDLAENAGAGVVTDWPGTPNFYQPSPDVPGYLTQTEMNDIIKYAKGKGIDIVPVINMPGHMGALLDNHTDWLVGSSKTTMNVQNEQAVAYALAILEKYAAYFQSQGVKYFSIGADEYCADVDGGSGVSNAKSNATLYASIKTFLNSCASVIKTHGMTPRAFSDFFDLDCGIDTDYQLYIWQAGRYGLSARYTTIDTSETWYWALGSSYYGQPATYPAKEPDAAASGAMMCIWCDVGNADGADGGLNVYNSTKTTVQSFSDNLKNYNCIVAASELNYTLAVNETAPVSFTLEGEYTEEQLAAKYAALGLDTAVVKPVVTSFEEAKDAELIRPGVPAKDPVVGTEAQTSITSGGQYVISDGKGNYLVNNGGTLSNTTTASEATVWTFTESNGAYIVTPNGGTGRLYIEGWDQHALKVADMAQTLSFDATDGLYSGSYYVAYQNGQWKSVQKQTSGGSTSGDYPAWDASKAYSTPNTYVTYEGYVYYNKWYADPGAIPGVKDVWALVGPASSGGGSSESTTALEGSVKLLTYTPGTEGSDDVWSTATPAKTTVGFKAVKEGTASMVVNGVTYNFTVGQTVTEEHHYGDWQSDETGHWKACTDEGCDATTTKVAHTGGTATCQAKAKCTVCGAEYGNLAEHTYTVANCKTPATCTVCGATTGDVDTSNHAHTELKNAVAATTTTEGYSGDLYCADCGELLSQGHVLPVIDPNAVKLSVAEGGTKTVTLDGHGIEEGSGSNDYVFWTVKQETTYPDKRTEVVKVTNPVNEAYLIGTGTKFLIVKEDGTLGYSEDADTATKWNITADADGNYTISYNGKYLQLVHIYGGSGDLSLVDSEPDAKWTQDGNGLYSTCSDGTGYLHFLGGSWGAATSNITYGYFCEAQEVWGDAKETTTITFTGKVSGETTVELGETKYQITVLPKELAEATPLTVDYRITNFAVTGKTSNAISAVIQAADAYGEYGAALADLVDATGTWAWGEADGWVAYWKGVYLEGKTQGGTGTGTDQTLQGADFQRIRYWDGQWSYLDTNGQWQTITVAAGNQVVAYYLNHTEVTKEVETRVVDWGYTKPSGHFDGTNNDLADGFALVDYDVRYASGVRSPANFPNDHTFSFHVLNDTGRNNGQVAGTGSTAVRRVGMSLGVNSEDFEVYMITVTRSNDDITKKLATTNVPSTIAQATNIGGADTDLYKGTEYVAWSKEEMTAEQMADLGLQKVPGLNGGDNTKINREAWWNAVATDYHYGGDPYVAAVYIGQNQGIRITFWIRETNIPEGTLQVNYHDITGGEDTIFHEYRILTHSTEDTFRDDIVYSNGTLENAKVVNKYDVTETVEADLTKMKGLISNTYITGAYNWVEFKLSEDKKTLDLYYQRAGAKIFVVDFGLPMTVTLGDLGFAAENKTVFTGFTINGQNLKDYETGKDAKITCQYGYAMVPRSASGENQDGNTAVFTYVPNTVILGPEHIVLKFGIQDANDMVVDVYIIPATTVYYEEGFATYTGNWTGGYTSGSYTQNQQTETPGESKKSNYGYDPVYAKGATTGSYGTQMTSGEDGIGDKATFQFKGTGVDILANTTTETGNAMVVLRDSEGTVKRVCTVDTHMENGTTDGLTKFQEVNGSNVPIVSLTGYPYGTYTVQVIHVKTTTQVTEKAEDGTEKTVNEYVSRPINLDGFRVYSPLADDATVGATTAGALYTLDSEDAPTFVELRDAVLATVTVPSNYNGQYANQVTNSQVFTGQSVKGFITTAYQGNASSEVVVDLLENGPKNEVYLAKDASLSFSYNASGYFAQIGLKGLNGATAYKLNGGDAQTLNSTTEMYYPVTPGDNNVVTITNTGSSILSVTKLKLIPNPAVAGQPEPALLELDEVKVAAAFRSISLAMANVTPEPEITEPEPDITPADTYDASAAYVGGDTVVCNGKTYRAKWWTQGENPETAEVWELVSDSEETSGDTTGPAAWDASKVYNSGDQVTYNGKTYQAKWWTQGETPNDAEWSAWKTI